MSAKLLYSLSDDNPNLQKQIGCMNGFLQFFDRRHVISSRSINRRLPPGENRHQKRDANATSKRSKEKHQKVPKEMQRNAVEPSRPSNSSSTGSTTMSSLEYDSTTKSEQSPFHETTSNKTNSSWDCKVMNQSHFSPFRSNSSPKMNHQFHTCASPIRTPKGEQVVDSPRLTSLNESFRSTSSNQSAPINPLRKKDPPQRRLSYDGTETRETFGFPSKFGDLRRLSLDSRQIERHSSRKLQDLPEEPGSYRPPSNIVAKLMGLEDLDSLSRSSQTIDESKLNRVLDSPRNNSKNLKPKEVEPESQNQSLTLYGEIEKKLADLDFKKSGKDLRALKQILEAMHKEKTIQEANKENQSSGSASETSPRNSNDIRRTKGSEKANQQLLHAGKVSRRPEDVKSPSARKSGKLIKKEEAGPTMHDVPLPRLHRFRFNQPVKNVLDLVDKKTAVKDTTPEIYCSQEPTSQTHCIMGRDFEVSTPRPIRASKAPEHVTKAKGKFRSSAKMSEAVSTTRVAENRHHSPTTTTTLVPRTKQYNQQTTRPRSRNQKLQQKSSILQDSDDQSSELSTDSVRLSQQTNAKIPQTDIAITGTDQSQSGMKHDALQQVDDSKSPERTRGEESFMELQIDIKEQPSPVSVLDVKFYGDESPSPVKKKPIAFTDDNPTSTAAEIEWKDIDVYDLPYSIRPSFSFDHDCEKLEKFKQPAQTLCQQNPNQGENITSASTSHKDVDLEKAYVAEILIASGFLDDLNFTEANHRVHQSKEAINPNLFFFLEQIRGNRILSYDETEENTSMRTNDKHRRKLLFQVVNEIVSQKLSQPQLFMNKLLGFRSGQQLLQEILKEVDQLQANDFHQSVDDEDDFLTTIIGKDLTRGSANWRDANSEISRVVLDIERLIFKDLIVELVHDEATHVQAHK